MHTKLASGCLLFAAAITTTSATLAAFAPLVITSAAGPSLVLTSTQVAVAVSAIAGLAIAKSALILATIHDKNKGRKRRETSEIDYSMMFESIDQQDVVDCGKLLVCQSFAKPEHKRTGEEKAVVGLFDDLSVIQPNAYGKYQWAAYAGTFRNPVICQERYSSCKVQGDILSNLINVQ